jgi:hypothetical protein
MTPRWLTQHLEATGGANPDGVNRSARITRCKDCGHRIIIGLDADKAALPVKADNLEIDELGEALAVISGLTTYALTMRTVSGQFAWQLDARTVEAIRGGRSHAVVPQHRCGTHLPPAEKPLISPHRNATPADAEPPF